MMHVTTIPRSPHVLMPNGGRHLHRGSRLNFSVTCNAQGATKKAPRRCARLGNDLLKGQPPQFRDLGCSEPDLRGLAAFAAMRHGGQIGGVCFQQVAISRHSRGGLGHVTGVFEGHNAGERHHMTRLKHRPGIV